MAATPKRAADAEKALVGADLDDPATWAPARAAIASDFQPLTDMRASAAYRSEVAANLLMRALDGNLGRRAPRPASESSVLLNRKLEVPVVPLETETAVVHKPHPHDSARMHVRGAAPYLDDIREPAGTLHVGVGMADKAAGVLRSLDLSAVRAAPGVVAVLTAGRHSRQERHRARLQGRAAVRGKGDPVPRPAAVRGGRATTRDAARRAARLAKIDIEEAKPAITVDDALITGERVLPDYEFGRGDIEASLASGAASAGRRLPHRRAGAFLSRGPGLARHPRRRPRDAPCMSRRRTRPRSQHIVARVLGVPDAFVTVETRRMGGGFGGKESQACQWAAIAALGARVTGAALQDPARPRRRFRPDRQAPRFPRRLARRLRRCGPHQSLRGRCSTRAAAARPIFRSASSTARCSTPPTPIGCEDVRIASRRLKTNTVSNTAFRGFGGPQGMIAIERVIDAIARERGLDPLDVRKANFYRPGGDQTPYNQTVEDLETLPAMIARAGGLQRLSRAPRRRSQTFNATSPILKKGIALTPVMFGISFTLIHLNQAGALVHVYSDGSIHLNHGGTEMGQGLFTKVAQVVAEEFGVPLDFVRITATNTAKVPNASPTAASSGTDINGMAAKIAAGQIRERMVAFAAETWGVAGGEDRVPRRPCLWRQRLDELRRTRQGLPAQPHPALVRRLLQDAGDFLGPRRREGQAVLLFRLRRGLRGSRDRHADRRDEGARRRHPARRRLLAQSRARPRPGRGRLRAGHGLGDDGRAGVRRARAA